MVDRYEASLGGEATTSKFEKATKISKWTLKDLSGEVQRLKASIESPLQLINLLVSL